MLIILIYVDDILVIGDYISHITSLIQSLNFFNYLIIYYYLFLIGKENLYIYV